MIYLPTRLSIMFRILDVILIKAEKKITNEMKTSPHRLLRVSSGTTLRFNEHNIRYDDELKTSRVTTMKWVYRRRIYAPHRATVRHIIIIIIFTVRRAFLFFLLLLPLSSRILQRATRMDLLGFKISCHGLRGLRAPKIYYINIIWSFETVTRLRITAES